MTATDLVLTSPSFCGQTGVVGKFVEYFGAGLSSLAVADRATLANMSPEYGATCGFFPVDELTLAYLRLTGRSGRAGRARRGATAERTSSGMSPTSTRVLKLVELDLGGVDPSIAGPRRPQDRVPLAGEVAVPRLAASFGVEPVAEELAETFPASDPTTEQAPAGQDGLAEPRRDGRRVGSRRVRARSRSEVELTRRQQS